MIKKDTEKAKIVLRIIEILLVALTFVIVLTAISNLRKNKNISGKERLGDTVRLAVMECYAAEGKYPPNLQYLVDNYGLQINDKYTVKYDIFAENIMPDVTVIEKINEK